jgi:hypothetical protein
LTSMSMGSQSFKPLRPGIDACARHSINPVRRALQSISVAGATAGDSVGIGLISERFRQIRS